MSKKNDEIDRSTLYGFEGPFQVFHADIANLQFRGKSAAAPQYCLVVVDLFSSKPYTYSMKLRKKIACKLEIFYKEIENKRKKGEKIRLQTNLDFKQKKNIRFEFQVQHRHVFYSDKVFAAEQKIWELKGRIFHLKSLEKRDGKSKTCCLKPFEIIRKLANNMNFLPSKKYEIEMKYLGFEQFKEGFDMNRIKKISREVGRQERYHKNIYDRKRIISSFNM